MNSGIYRESGSPYVKDVLRVFAAKVYAWMTVMLLATAVVSVLAIHQGMVRWFGHHPVLFVMTLMVEVMLVALFAVLRKSLNFFLGLLLVGTYTFLTGLTLSVILARYQPTTVALSFFSTAGVFGLASAYGILTKRSLEGIGGWLFLGLLGLIAAMVASAFIGQNPMDYLISGVAVVIFTGLAAYDAQMVQKRASTNSGALAALDCALGIYLDFLNLFLHILRLFGMSSQKND